jgi:hypothetical protein
MSPPTTKRKAHKKTRPRKAHRVSSQRKPNQIAPDLTSQIVLSIMLSGRLNLPSWLPYLGLAKPILRACEQSRWGRLKS